MLPGICSITGMVGGNGALMLTYVGNNNTSVDDTVKTWAAEPIGDEAPDRYVIIAITGTPQAGTATVDSVTIGGVTATVVVQTSSTYSLSAIAIAAVPSGTTADIVVTFSQNQYRHGIAVWNVTGLSSPAAVGTDTSTSADPGMSAAATSGGFAIMTSTAYIGVTAVYTDMTERYDEMYEGTYGCHSGADAIDLDSNPFTPSLEHSAGTYWATALATFY